MKKLLSFIAIAACGVVLFASCESSEAVTRNLLEYQGYRYNIANAQQSVTYPDTLFAIEDGDTTCAGFMYSLILNSPGIGVDTLDPNNGNLYYSYPTDGRKWAQIELYLISPGLNEICEGTYTITADDSKGVVLDEDKFFKIAWCYVNYGAPNIGTATKVITDRDAMWNQVYWFYFDECTVTIKKGMVAYDIELKAVDDYGNTILAARYTGFVPKVDKLIKTCH